MVRDKPRRRRTNRTSHALSCAGAWVKTKEIPAAREGHARCFPAIGEDRLGWTEVGLLMVWAVSTNGQRKGAEKIADSLKQNRTIKTLDLGGNNIHGEGISKLAQALKDNDTITTLEISYNPIGPEGAEALSEVLKFHGNVKNLKLGWCKIGPKGAEFIAETLKYNTTISVLDLRGNGLRDEGATCLARSLKVVNEALTSLDLGFNEIRDPGAFAIAQALKANEDIAVTSLNLANNFLTKFGQSALTDARDHVHEMCEREVCISY